MNRREFFVAAAAVATVAIAPGVVRAAPDGVTLDMILKAKEALERADAFTPVLIVVCTSKRRGELERELGYARDRVRVLSAGQAVCGIRTNDIIAESPVYDYRYWQSEVVREHYDAYIDHIRCRLTPNGRFHVV